MSNLTQEDRNMIGYFILEKGDIRSWCHWLIKYDIIAEEYPELIAAISALDVAEKTLDRIAESICNE